MKYGSFIGWGIVIYAVMFLVWNGLVMHGIMGTSARILLLITLAMVATIAGRSLRFSSVTDIIPYSLCWMIIVALLDAVYAVPSSGWQLYADWNVWVGYILVFAFPLIAPYTRSGNDHRV
ncbi:MAG: hypothetical protein JWM46_327 [Candidatus Kaiserbacteria bacterium]|nr:hypothetical protein [Candidatus Kaiserbacteria bacterium]